MAPSFSQAEIFPVIARLIMQSPGSEDGLVRHDAIVAAVLTDAEGSHIADLAAGSPEKRRAVASNMVAWFSQQITIGRSPWCEVFYRTKIGRTYAYRAIASGRAAFAPDVDFSAVEGESRLLFHLRRERNVSLALAKRNLVLEQEGELVCEVCAFSSRGRYPGLGSEICEVHHRLPLSEAMGPRETKLEDLAILCPNCHRAIHKTIPLLSVEQFRLQMLNSQKATTAAKAGRGQRIDSP